MKVRAPVPVAGVALLALLALPAPHATAQQSSQVVIIPLGGSVPGGSTERFDAALASAGQKAGARIEVAQVSRDDVFALAGCHSESPACLRRVRETLDVDAVLVGSVEPAEGGARVTILLAERNRPATRVTYDVSGEPAEMEVELEAKAGELFARSSTSPEGGSEVEPDAVEPDAGAGAEGDAGAVQPGEGAGGRNAGGTWNRPPYRFQAGEVDGWAWGLTAGGGGAIVLGLVCYSVAASRQDAVNEAPDSTFEDIERLRDLERSGKRWNLLGNTFTLLGLGAAVTGGVFVMRQGLVRTEEPELTVAPMPLPGGGGIALSWSPR